ncbi:MAG: MarR family winged helix-turn-helix transcriptional regulator [Pseudomonadota bacterium]
MDSRAVAELIVHLGRIGSGEGGVAGLSPVQWAALRYFARANRFSRTPSGFAAFHGTTRGTASQTIKGLVAAGYLTQHRSQADGRSVRLSLTDKARAILADDPIKGLAAAADGLPPGMRDRFSDSLLRVLGQLAEDTGQPLFGTCRSCAHFGGEGCCLAGDPVYACRFANETLSEAELDEFCINFVSEAPRSSERPQGGRV